MTVDDKILTRVRGLLAQARGTDNPFEAETFSMKAAELIDKYRIDMAALTPPGEGPVFGSYQYTLRGRPNLRASHLLLCAVAAHYGVIVITPSTGNTKDPTLAGTADDIEMVILMFDSLALQRDTACKAEPVPYGIATVTFRNSFAYGYAARIHGRLQELRNRQKAEATAASSSTALVLFDRGAQVTKWLEANMDNFSPGAANRNRPEVSRRGMEAGDRAASRADLGGPRLSGTPTARPALT